LRVAEQQGCFSTGLTCNDDVETKAVASASQTVCLNPILNSAVSVIRRLHGGEPCQVVQDPHARQTDDQRFSKCSRRLNNKLIVTIATDQAGIRAAKMQRDWFATEAAVSAQ